MQMIQTQMLLLSGTYMYAPSGENAVSAAEPTARVSGATLFGFGVYALLRS